MRTLGGDILPSSLSPQWVRDSTWQEPAGQQGGQVCCRAGDLTATSSGHRPQGCPAGRGTVGSSEANLPRPSVSGEMHRGKRLRPKIAASDLRPLPKRNAAASRMCFHTGPASAFILHRQTRPGEHHTTPVSSDRPQHWPSTTEPKGPRGPRQHVTSPWLSPGRIPEKQGILSGEKCRLALPLTAHAQQLVCSSSYPSNVG